MGSGDPCICGTGCRMGRSCVCCPWCCATCKSVYCGECWGYYGLRKQGKQLDKCGTSQCKIKCIDVYNCQCKCCRKKCDDKDATCKPLPPPPPVAATLSSTGAQVHSAPSGAQHLQATEEQSRNLEAQTHDEYTSPSFTPDPQAIAAVIVAIIVAIILLDLCIFRFPVGRNIRDFLVRKIPFCIAFYS
ncbi:hypothetical protein BBBOND_0200090 [Babesia bigemina]|uniref:Uncharacterized protein n=1 Tax=Babesia bigemina TaxID=5866 RepID=A0A061D481_BABBI|nr:hypothetical protein BBBOND_0200090 [Babesia bigemina]CDR94852.1 hypothetical protein BBBOND_0200090 [Babesia bigemina]|eukprot:XP_012767038.1 hypothetical protein BBBOND_0200090 [Babesia bigemina]